MARHGCAARAYRMKVRRVHHVETLFTASRDALFPTHALTLNPPLGFTCACAVHAHESGRGSFTTSAKGRVFDSQTPDCKTPDEIFAAWVAGYVRVVIGFFDSFH